MPSYMAATGASKTRVDDNKEKVEAGRITASAPASDIGKFAQKKRGPADTVTKGGIASDGDTAETLAASKEAEEREKRKHRSEPRDAPPPETAELVDELMVREHLTESPTSKHMWHGRLDM